MEDCGGGIGRVALNLLTKEFDTTDLLEPAANLIEKAKESMAANPKMGDFYHIGLHEFDFNKKYDIVWMQWVVGHLTDNDLIECLKK